MRSFTCSSADPSVVTGYANLFQANPTPIRVVPPVHRPKTTVHTPRPSCLATPGPHSFFDLHPSSLPLSAHTVHRVTRAIQGAWASTTLRRYSGAVRQFLLFCDRECVPADLRFPADEFVLCAFAASSLGRHAGGTPKARLSALKAWHTSHNVEWKGSARLRYVLNGVANHAPGPSSCPPRPPINARMLVQLIESLDLNSPLDAAVAACAVVAFWGQCRLGELLPLFSSPLLSPPVPTHSDFKRSLRNPLACILFLPRTKTHRRGQEVVLVDQRDPINPITLLKNHIRVNSIQNNSPLFSFTSPSGYVLLNKNLFLRRCNQVWSSFGYPRTTGHSFRIGGTTELLSAGVPPDVVRTTGRWSSSSFLRYWRSLDSIVPQHVRNLHSRVRRYKNKR